MLNQAIQFTTSAADVFHMPGNIFEEPLQFLVVFGPPSHSWRQTVARFPACL